MDKTRMTLQIQPLTIENVAEGQAARDFESAVADVAGAFVVPSDGVIPWELSGEKAKAKVTITFEFVHDFGTGTTSVTERCTVAMPKKKKASRPVLVRDGVIYTEGGGQQLSLIERERSANSEDA